jgi:glutamine amidotransferase-like uncharacterized protein
VEAVLDRSGIPYSTAGSAEMNEMIEAQLRGYRLLVIPGGNFVDIGNSLSPDATANIRRAVKGGLSYLGICAGAFMAGNSPYNGINLTSGVRFRFYSAENRGVRKTAVAVTSPAGSTLDQYWEDGPELTGWGETVAKYPEGTPAVVEGTYGMGWIVLSGVHPEAPEDWRRGMTFSTPAPADNEYAAKLIHAAMNREALPHF